MAAEEDHQAFTKAITDLRRIRYERELAKLIYTANTVEVDYALQKFSDLFLGLTTEVPDRQLVDPVINVE